MFTPYLDPREWGFCYNQIMKKSHTRCNRCLKIKPRDEFRIRRSGARKGHLIDRTCSKCSLSDLKSRGYLSSYRKYKTNQCRVCEQLLHPCQLDVNHIDGNHFNNDPSNLETLCANCHRLHTYLNKHTSNRY